MFVPLSLAIKLEILVNQYLAVSRLDSQKIVWSAELRHRLPVLANGSWRFQFLWSGEDYRVERTCALPVCASPACSDGLANPAGRKVHFSSSQSPVPAFSELAANGLLSYIVPLISRSQSISLSTATDCVHLPPGLDSGQPF